MTKQTFNISFNHKAESFTDSFLVNGHTLEEMTKLSSPKEASEVHDRAQAADTKTHADVALAILKDEIASPSTKVITVIAMGITICQVNKDMYSTVMQRLVSPDVVKCTKTSEALEIILLSMEEENTSDIEIAMNHLLFIGAFQHVVETVMES